MSNPRFVRHTVAPLLYALAGSATLGVSHDVSAQEHTDTALETVLVRAARVPTPLASLSSSITVIDAEQLQQRQLATLGEVLRSVPGLAINRGGGFGSNTQLRTRGSEGNHTLVFIDGVRVNDPAISSEFNFAHQLTHDIERIEVIRGPQSALWGTDALAGVINITTRQRGQGSNGSLSSEVGSDRWRNLAGDLQHGTETLQARLGIAQLSTHGDNISREGDEDDGYRNRTGSATVTWTPAPQLQLSTSLRDVDSRADFDGTDFSTGLPTDADNTSHSRQRYGRIAVQFRSDDGLWEHMADYSIAATRNRNRSENAFTDVGFDETRNRGERELVTLQSTRTLDLGALEQSVTGAYEHQREAYSQRGAASVFGDPNRDESLRSNSLISEYRASLGPWSAQASLRRDRNNAFRNSGAERLGVVYDIADTDTRLRASYGTGVKNPSFVERFGFFTSFIGNPDLKPERSRGWEAGIDQTLAGGRVVLSATGFNERLRDEINGFVLADPALFTFTADNEAGTSIRRGVETSARWQASDSLALRAAYTYLDSRQPDAVGGREREVRRPRHTGSAGLNWAFADTRANLDIAVDYNGRQLDFFFPPVPPFQETVTLDAFLLLHLALSYQLTPQWQVFGRVENALDETYEEVFGFRSPNRAAIAGVRYRF